MTHVSDTSRHMTLSEAAEMLQQVAARVRAGEHHIA